MSKADDDAECVLICHLVSAAELLSELVTSIHIVSADGEATLVSAPIDLIERLCEWGAEAEDIEDDDPVGNPENN